MKINYKINNFVHTIYIKKKISNYILNDIERLNSDRKILIICDQNVDKKLIKAHTSIEIIKQKILKLEDLFERDHKYKKIDIDSEYPEYIRNNLHLFNNWII